MQVSLQDIRNLGYKKIYASYCGCEYTKEDFFEALRDMSATLSSFRMPAYSLMHFWGSIKVLDSRYFGGIKSLVLSQEPLISTVEPSNASKRKLRNAWNLLFDKFCETCELDGATCYALKDIGTKLPIYASAKFHEDEMALQVVKYKTLLDASLPRLHEVAGFYTVVISWFLLTSSESDLLASGRSLNDLLLLLTTMNNDEFTDKLLEGVLWA